MFVLCSVFVFKVASIIAKTYQVIINHHIIIGVGSGRGPLGQALHGNKKFHTFCFAENYLQFLMSGV